MAIMTNVDWQWLDWSKGIWRTARKEHRCDSFFYRRCQFGGRIFPGERYFDTQELGGVSPWTTYRVCGGCADAAHETMP